jgi:hypothetical protein
VQLDLWEVTLGRIVILPKTLSCLLSGSSSLNGHQLDGSIITVGCDSNGVHLIGIVIISY